MKVYSLIFNDYAHDLEVAPLLFRNPWSGEYPGKEIFLSDPFSEEDLYIQGLETALIN